MTDENTIKEPENKEPEKVEAEKSGEVLETSKPVQDGEKTGKDPITGKFLPNNTFGGSHPDSNGRISLKRKLIEMLPTILKGQSMPCFQALIMSLVVRAINGDMQAMKLIWQYVEGDPKQSILLETSLAQKEERDEAVEKQAKEGFENLLMQMEALRHPLKPVIYDSSKPAGYYEKENKEEPEKDEPKEVKTDQPKLNPNITILPNGATFDSKGPAIITVHPNQAILDRMQKDFIG